MQQDSDALVIGVDLGGSKIASAAVNTHGKIVSRDYRATPITSDPQMLVQEILSSVNATLDKLGYQAEKVGLIGIAVAGFSNPESGVVYTSPNLPALRNVPLRDIIESKANKKAFLINDAKAAALGEFYFGAARGTRNFIYITLSTGIGGGIIIDGRLYFGAIGTAGEVGHMTIDTDGPPCHCGSRGCWESLASGTALAREARAHINKGVTSSILDDAGGDFEKITAAVVHIAAQKGDTLAGELITKSSFYVGVGLVNLINIFNPELIVIGGGLSNLGEMLFAPAMKLVKERICKEVFQSFRLEKAQLGVDSGVLGAVVYVWQEMSRKGAGSR